MFRLKPYRGAEGIGESGLAAAMEARTIGKAAREAGVGVESIPFYERRGLMEQPPKPAGARMLLRPALDDEALQRPAT